MVKGVAEAAVMRMVAEPGETVPLVLWKESELGVKVRAPVLTPEVLRMTGIEIGLFVMDAALLFAVTTTAPEYTELTSPETFGVMVSWVPLWVTVSHDGSEVTERVVRALESLANTDTTSEAGVGVVPEEVNRTVPLSPAGVGKPAWATGFVLITRFTGTCCVRPCAVIVICPVYMPAAIPLRLATDTGRFAGIVPEAAPANSHGAPEVTWAA